MKNEIRLIIHLSTMGQNPGDAIHLKLGKAKGFKKLFKTFNKTNVGVDYHNNWPNLIIAASYDEDLTLLLKLNGHNTFWPWITGIEMLASSRFRRFEECNILLSKLASRVFMNFYKSRSLVHKR